MKPASLAILFLLPLTLLSGCIGPTRVDKLSLSTEEEEEFYTDVQDARKLLDDAKESGQNAEVQTYLSLANAYERLSKFQKSEKTLLEARNLYPGNESIANNLYVLYGNFGMYSKAEKELIAVLQNPINWARNLELARLYLDMKDKKGAMEAYRKYLLHNPPGTADEILEQRIKMMVVD